MFLLQKGFDPSRLKMSSIINVSELKVDYISKKRDKFIHLLPEVKLEPELPIILDTGQSKNLTSTEEEVETKQELVTYQIIFPEPEIKAEPELQIEDDEHTLQLFDPPPNDMAVTRKFSKFKCEICKAVLKSINQLKLHRQVVHATVKSVDTSKTCSFCKDTFTRFSALIRHVQSHYSDPEKFHCDKCSTHFSTFPQVYNHYRSKHSSNIFQCLLCPAIYKTKFYLEFHMLIHPNKFIKTYECSVCSAVFPLKRDLDFHTKTVHKPAFTKFECHYCKKCFPFKHPLVMHMNSHKDGKFRCLKCKEKLSNSDSLISHICFWEKQCSRCQLTFKTRSSCMKHYKANDCNISSKPKLEDGQSLRQQYVKRSFRPKKFMCHYCSKAFMTKGSIKCHLIRHFSEKKCRKCDATFPSYVLRNLHFKSVHSVSALFSVKRI